VEEIVEDEGVGQQGIYNNCRFHGNIICYITFISLLKINYFNYFLYILCMQKRKPMHKFCPYYTLQLQIEGYLKFKKKIQKYPATLSRGVFKIFEKKIEKYPASPSCGV